MFGDVWIEIEPNPGGGVEFAEKVVGGSVPRNFFPGVEKGIRETAAEGVFAGYPLSDFKATLYDGSFHTVDSNELSFKIAASMALKDGILAGQAGPPRADHDRRDPRARGVHGRGQPRPQRPARARARHGQPGRHAGHHRPRARSPSCSPTPRSSSRSPAAAGRSPRRSTATTRCPPTSPRRSSSSTRRTPPTPARPLTRIAPREPRHDARRPSRRRRSPRRGPGRPRTRRSPRATACRSSRSSGSTRTPRPRRPAPSLELLAAGRFEVALSEYPPSDYGRLIDAAAARYGVAREELLVGAGADEILDLVAKTFIPHGGAAIVPIPTYPMYGILTDQRGAHGRPRPAPAARRPASRSTSTAIRAAVRAADPGDPASSGCATPTTRPATRRAGGRHRGAARRAPRGRRRRPAGRAPAVAPRRGLHRVRRRERPAPLRERYPRLVVARTMSKAYAIAGPPGRVRASRARRLIDEIATYRPPGSVSIVSVDVAAALLPDDALDARPRRRASLAERARFADGPRRRRLGRPRRRRRTSCSSASPRPRPRTSSPRACSSAA